MTLPPDQKASKRSNELFKATIDMRHDDIKRLKKKEEEEKESLSRRLKRIKP
jgi:hypothetical protein